MRRIAMSRGFRGLAIAALVASGVAAGGIAYASIDWNKYIHCWGGADAHMVGDEPPVREDYPDGAEQCHGIGGGFSLGGCGVGTPDHNYGLVYCSGVRPGSTGYCKAVGNCADGSQIYCQDSDADAYAGVDYVENKVFIKCGSYVDTCQAF